MESSSFLILGTCDSEVVNRIINRIIKMNNIKQEDLYKYESENGLKFLLDPFCVMYVGVYPLPLINKMTLPQAIKKVQKYFRFDFGIEIGYDLIELHYGETYN